MDDCHFSDSDYQGEDSPPTFNINDTSYAMKVLSFHTQTLWWPSTIPRITLLPTNLTAFYRDYVAQSRPCIIENAFDTWNALRLWDFDYLRQQAGALEISADFTPSGHGDCVVASPDTSHSTDSHIPEDVPPGGRYDATRCFVKPFQQKIKFSDCLDSLHRHHVGTSLKSDNVIYIQHQNDNFRKEFISRLGGDIDSSIEEWGNSLFGSKPDAINLWLGDSRAVSSMHKDHYENLYCVIKGTKIFTLVPPTDFPWLEELWFREANYTPKGGKLEPELQSPESAIPWISIDPDNPPVNCPISPLKVKVHAGEMLYLPSLVYHKVAQKEDPSEGAVIAINYWWDMQYGPLYSYFKFLEASTIMRDNLALHKSGNDTNTCQSNNVMLKI